MNDPFENHAGKLSWIEHTMIWINSRQHQTPAMHLWMTWAEQRVMSLKEEEA